MKEHYFLLILNFICLPMVAQVFDVDTLQYKGSTDKFINIAIMGDGYTAEQQDLFVQKAAELSNSLFTQSPWNKYQNYFNVFAIKVISNQSGTRHPGTASDCNTASVPIAAPNTYFNCRFDYLGIHRLVVPQSNATVASVLAANLPNYDQALIIANSPYYGGSGGAWATCTTDDDAYEVTAHEIGHSFANLADEYYAGENYFMERPNMTQQSDPTLIKWKNWVVDNSVSIHNYCCGGTTAQWFKPSNFSCKMQVNGADYCKVCQQTIIEKIHLLANPIVAYLPMQTTIQSPAPALNFELSELMLPVPNTLHIKWQLDSTTFDNNSTTFTVDQNTLSIGTHTLTAIVTDDTPSVRVDNHSTTHADSVTWTINRGVLGVDIFTSENSIGFAVYPNPAEDIVNVELELEQSANVYIRIISADGKIVREIGGGQTAPGDKSMRQINIENLTSGDYFIAVTINGATYTHTLIKQ